MATTRQDTSPAPSTGGIFGGISARLAEGKATGWGVFHPGSGAMVLGGLLMIVAAFLPWVQLSYTEQLTGETFAFRGTDGPGVVTLALGFLAFAGAFVPRRRLAIAHAGAAGAVVALITAAQAWNILAFSSRLDAWGAFLPGMGLVMAAGGAVILIKVAIRMWRRWPAAKA